MTMTFVISDLHGQFDSYEKLLSKTQFKDTDTLYLLGDMIDYGEDGIRILLDAMSRPNVFPIMGEREYTAVRLLSRMEAVLAGRKENTEAFQKEFAQWIGDGGMPTVSAYRELDEDTRTDILDYLKEECVPYEIVEAAGKTFLLVHAGLANYAPGRDIEDYSLKELIYGGGTFPAEAPDGMILVTGHTPTEQLDEENGGRILISPHHIAMDCGAWDGGFAGCLCLETGKTYYA